MELSFDLPATLEAAPLARSRLATLSGALRRSVLVDLLLVVTELVGHSLREGATSALRVSVWSSAPEAVTGELAGGARPAGWSEQLLEAMVSRWGVRDGSRVWFEIRHA